MAHRTRSVQRDLRRFDGRSRRIVQWAANLASNLTRMGSQPPKLPPRRCIPWRRPPSPRPFDRGAAPGNLTTEKVRVATRTGRKAVS